MRLKRDGQTYCRGAPETMVETVEERLKALCLDLPEAPQALANYVTNLVTGSLLFISGQISKAADGTVISGILGGGHTIAEGEFAARQCALSILAQSKAALGSLDRIERVVRITGYVASTPEFRDHPQVINGASDLLVAVLGDAGRHTRAAIGVASLPFGAAVEIDAIMKVRA